MILNQKQDITFSPPSIDAYQIKIVRRTLYQLQ